MAVLHRKEEKIQAVLGRLPKKYSPDDFVAMFIKLYSKDWGKIKSAYIKASQDKQPGTVIHMPKPELYLKQVLEIFLSQPTFTKTDVPKEEIIAATPVIAKEVKIKAPVKKTEKEEPLVVVKKAAAKKVVIAEDVVAVKKQKATPTAEKPVTKSVKAKAPAKKSITDEEPVVAVKKVRAAAKKKVD